jgi:hypothetical protein
MKTQAPHNDEWYFMVQGLVAAFTDSADLKQHKKCEV